jgi:PAS domain S-box-containing protein
MIEPGGFGCDAALLLAALVRAAGDAKIAVLIADAAGDPSRVLTMNPEARRLLEVDDGESQLSPRWLFQAGMPAANGQPMRFETEIPRRSGVGVPVQVALSRASLGERELWLAFFTDLSDRRAAETALVASEARFRALVESAPDGVVILRQMRIVFLNPRAAEILGIEAPAALGRSILDLLPPDQADSARERLTEVGHTRAFRSEPATYTLRSPSGLERLVEVSSIPVEYEDGPAVMALARDVTERRALEAKLLAADRLVVVGTLAAGITHEINNPLSYVLLNLERLRRELTDADGDPERLARMKKSVENAHHGASRIESIVKDLRSFARVEDEARGPVDMAVVLESALRLAENQIRHRANLVKRIAPVPPVEANAGRLEQVFVNLLVNAAQALSEGDATRDEIRVSLREEPNGQVVLEVEDTGPGMSHEVLERVFDPFFSTKPVGVGTGLGLTICQNIVGSLGGEISVRSVAGQGTTVRVALPAMLKTPLRMHPSGLHRRADLMPNAHPRGRVMVVDDDRAVAYTLGMVLEDEHDVTIVLSGREALARLDGASDWPHAIIVDLMMPGMSGADLYRAIASRWPGLEERVVFITGGVFDGRAQAFLESVPNLQLHKPVESARIHALLRELVAKRG